MFNVTLETYTLKAGSNNALSLTITDPSRTEGFSTVNRVVFRVLGDEIDSAVVPDDFDWTGDADKLDLKIKGTDLVTKGLGYATLIIYDPTNPEGVIVFDECGYGKRLYLQVC